MQELKKIPDVSRLVTNTPFNTKLREVEKKNIPDDSKYITTNEFNKISDELFDGRLKQAKLTAANDFNTVEQSATKNKKERNITNIWFKTFY